MVLLSLLYDYEKLAKTNATKDWVGLDITFDYLSTQLSIFLGSQKGGLVCANGVCVQQPSFLDGVKITLRSMF